MTPQERQLIDDLFGRLSKVEGSPRDSDAMAAIMQGLRTAPNAIYALVQIFSTQVRQSLTYPFRDTRVA